MEFKALRDAVAKQFDKMQKHQLFRVDLSKEELNGVYLSSFPEGSDPMYRERTEHDCSCCRSFIGAVGNAVALIDGKIVSIWDVGTIKDEPEYTIVAKALSDAVHSSKIRDVFFHFENKAGQTQSLEGLIGGGVKKWDHFFVNIKPQFVKEGKEQPEAMAVPRDARQVFIRGLKELTTEAIEVVLDLIASDSIYRGKDHEWAVTEFAGYKLKADNMTSDQLEVFTWDAVTSGKVQAAVWRMNNTLIGRLMQDIIKGMDLELAVKLYEKDAAPENYQRSTAVITAGMIKKAQEKVAELGLTSALQRRYATIDDITINNVLFANRDAKKAMSNSGDVFDMLAPTAPVTVKDFSKVEEVPIAKFLSDVLPRAKQLEVMLEGRHQTNLVTLLAPVDATAGSLFYWGNNFTWSYKGGLTDSAMRRAVQERGGSVDGVIRFSHSWNHDGHRNTSLMDGHVFMPASNIKPESGINDSYGNSERVGWNHRSHSKSGGVQDVDHVQAARVGEVPVENITWNSLAKMPEGTYIYKIHNWDFRNPTTGGGKAEIEFEGQIFEYDYSLLKNKEWTTIAEVTLKNGTFTIKHHAKLAGSTSQTIWGMQSNEFHNVNIALLSPNYWDENAGIEDAVGTGNKHYFFMLEGAKADEHPRGFSNEFLRADLKPHRKVFEVLSHRLIIEQSDDQLTGLGFSYTKRDSVVVRVTGSTKRIMRIVF